MIILNLPINGKKAQCDCLTATTYSVISNLGKNYINMFALFWGFQYNFKEKKPLDERFNRSGLIHTADYDLCKITGIEILHQENAGTPDHMKSIIKNYTENGCPISIQLDAFNCPWNIAYQKVHFNHYILTLGYKSDILLCQDPFCYINMIELNQEMQSYIGRDYYIYNIYDTREMLPEERITMLQDAVQHYIATQIHEKISEFANDFAKQVDYFSKIRLINPVIMNPFFIKMKSIVSDRLNFLLFLEEIKIIMPDKFKLIVNYFRNISKYWQDTYFLMVKTMMRVIDSNVLIQIGKRLTQLANYEHYIAMKFINWVFI